MTPDPHFASKLATVRSIAELDGFAAQKRADGATDEEIAAIVRRRAELQREGRA